MEIFPFGGPSSKLLTFDRVRDSIHTEDQLLILVTDCDMAFRSRSWSY
jgi:hypothetical protein